MSGHDLMGVAGFVAAADFTVAEASTLSQVAACCPMQPAFGYLMPAMAVYELAFRRAQEVVAREARVASWRRRYVEPNPN